MGVAEVISFVEVRARKQWEALRQPLHERFAPWLDTLEQPWHEPPSTLPEVTATMWALRQQLTGGLTATIVAHVPRCAHDRPQLSCPQGEAVLTARELVRRPVETMVGPIQLERPYFSCRSWRASSYPSDDMLGGVPGCKQLAMQRATASLVTEVPYDPAQTLFRELTGRSFGSERMHTVANHVAAGLTVLEVAPSREEGTRRVDAVAAGRCRRRPSGVGWHFDNGCYLAPNIMFGPGGP